MKDDHYLAYFRPERKTMYKRGMSDTLGPVFEHQLNFGQFYRTFTYQTSYVREVLANQKDYTGDQLQEFKQLSTKHFGQFLDDSKALLVWQTEGVEGTPNGFQELFNDLISIVNGPVFDMQMHLLPILKEGRQALEVLDDVLGPDDQLVKSTQSLKAMCQAFHDKANGLAKTPRRHEFVSFLSVVYGMYAANQFELLGDVLKHATPNLKKKRGEQLDRFKAEVIKPLKEVMQGACTFFEQLAQEY